MLTPPLSFTWADLVDALVEERGSLAELVRVLYELHPQGLPEDPQSVERALRRLRARRGSGDRYGRLLLRHFGLPADVQRWARALGQYHSRLNDLPAGVRADQLRLWDRPPVSESAQAAWVHLALASLAHQQGDRAALTRRLELAELGVGRAGCLAQVELLLFRARLLMDEQLATDALALLDQADAGLQGATEPTQRVCLAARALDQRAYILSRGWRAEPGALIRALALYRQIPEVGPAFVRLRRHQGEAWCLWRLQDPGALAQAHLAVEAAGDGGYLRLRAVALKLCAQILGPGPRADALCARAAGIRDELGEA